MNTKTPEERAAEAFPDPSQEDMAILSIVPDGLYEEGVRICIDRSTYATCIREEVEPLEAENANLRALVQELVNALDGEQFWSSWLPINQMDDSDQSECIADGRRSDAAMKSAKEHGFVPTNTTEG